jgi:hypothetical protein
MLRTQKQVGKRREKRPGREKKSGNVPKSSKSGEKNWKRSVRNKEKRML